MSRTPTPSPSPTSRTPGSCKRDRTLPPAVPTPQHGIFALGTRSHHHLQLDVVDGADPDELPASCCASCGPRARRSRASTSSSASGPGPASCCCPTGCPRDSSRSRPTSGPTATRCRPTSTTSGCGCTPAAPTPPSTSPTTPPAALDGLAVVAAEQPSFTYQASRDLTGFEDGTENPPLDEAPAAATIPEGAAGRRRQRRARAAVGARPRSRFGELATDATRSQVIGRSNADQRRAARRRPLAAGAHQPGRDRGRRRRGARDLPTLDRVRRRARARPRCSWPSAPTSIASTACCAGWSATRTASATGSPTSPARPAAPGTSRRRWRRSRG